MLARDILCIFAHFLPNCGDCYITLSALANMLAAAAVEFTLSPMNGLCYIANVLILLCPKIVNTNIARHGIRGFDEVE